MVILSDLTSKTYNSAIAGVFLLLLSGSCATNAIVARVAPEAMLHLVVLVNYSETVWALPRMLLLFWWMLPSCFKSIPNGLPLLVSMTCASPDARPCSCLPHAGCLLALAPDL